MAWRVAESLIKLRQQLNTAYPNRNKASDGTIGDPNHQAEGTGSDHNPNAAGVVCAFDITHDPASGLDIVKLAQALADSRDPRIKYLIRNRQIMVPADYGWKWVAYTGSNPHTSHLHISVYGNYDNTTNWKIGEKTMAIITTEAVVALSIATTGKQPSNADETKYVGKEATQENLDGLITYWANKSLIRELEQRLASAAPSKAATVLKAGLYEVK